MSDDKNVVLEQEQGEPVNYLVKDYKSQLKPIWCAGCGDYGVVNAIYRSLAELNIPPHEIAFFSGIGCSSRIPGYTTSYGFNSVHGRALPMAIGAKLYNPALTVLVAGGDGDGFSIGGNHIPHAIRRNINLCYIVMDNNIYALTKGQLSPTTPEGDVTVTSALGSIDRPINPLQLVLSYGCGFVAQGASHDIRRLQQLIRAGIQYKGFAFINVISPCVTYRGGSEQFEALREKSYNLEDRGHDPTDKLSAFKVCEGYGSEYAIGVIYKDTSKKDYNTLFEGVFEKAKDLRVYPREEVYKKFIPY